MLNFSILNLPFYSIFILNVDWNADLERTIISRRTFHPIIKSGVDWNGSQLQLKDNGELTFIQLNSWMWIETPL